MLVKKGSTVGDVARKVMGDAPVAFVETTGGVRVAEDDPVRAGKNDVSWGRRTDGASGLVANALQILSFKVGRA